MSKSSDLEARESRHDRAIEAISRLEKENGHRAALCQLLEFMSEYLSLTLGALPIRAKEAFEIAVKFRTALTMNEQMERARDACWQYLSSYGSNHDFRDKENCAIRAALCLIQREPPKIDLAETCYWFLSFADEVEDHSHVIDHLVAKYFAVPTA
jgi:hypothetical protein